MNKNVLVVLFSSALIIQGAEQEVDALPQDHTPHNAIHGIIDFGLPADVIALIGSCIGESPYVRKLKITQVFDEARNKNAGLNLKSWSPDWSLSASCDGTNAKVHQKDILLPHPEKVTAVCWISDTLLATGSEDRRVRLWDITFGECFASGLGNYKTIETTYWERPPWGPGPNRKVITHQKSYENKPIASIRFINNTLIIGDTDGKMYRWEFASKYLPELCTAAMRKQLQQNKETKCIIQ